MPKVWNKRDPNVPREAIYVGRPTKWGNPFKVGIHGDRDVCVRLFRKSCCSDDYIRQAREELRGKDLVCWCAPAACHADVLLELANNENINKKTQKV
jgi:hypothetical protein